MSGNAVEAVRASSENLKNAILRSVSVDRADRKVEISVITDRSFTDADLKNATAALKPYVPGYFGFNLNISKLSPDCDMVKRKIREIIGKYFVAAASTMRDDDIKVEKTERGFKYTVGVFGFARSAGDICAKISQTLKKCFCGEFEGECVSPSFGINDLAVEDKPDEPDFIIPVRTFEIRDFGFLEGTKKQTSAIYIADLNFAADEAVLCGTIENIREKTYVGKSGAEKTYLSLTVSDTTAAVNATYFIRQKTSDKIKALKPGDSVVLTGANEDYKGNLRFTAKYIDYGKIPDGFVPVKRASKPVPLNYHRIFPQAFSDAEQTDIFSKSFIPDCLKQNTFVVFDLETTGLNSSPVSGNMDKIIEIGAYKIENGEISQCFSTFVNPQKQLSQEIVKLTGITGDMVKDAPSYEEVMPDFFKFCSGSILVGHNIVNFDFKFVDYYCGKLGYNLDAKIIDTFPLAQELLFLSNYKLNTVADKFNVAFNHHRATDDALATAKIFIELIKIKKSLPKL